MKCKNNCKKVEQGASRVAERLLYTRCGMMNQKESQAPEEAGNADAFKLMKELRDAESKINVKKASQG